MICANCGAALSPEASTCTDCGAQVRAAVQPPQTPSRRRGDQAELTPEEAEFERRLYRFPPVTALLLGLCVLIWAAMEALGGSEDPTLLLIFGAKHKELIVDGQVWRLITASFLHIGWKHLLFNGIALVQLGLFCENIFGAGRFITLYLLTGVGGFALATAFSDAISAGASASLFGLMGAMLVFGWQHRRDIPPFFQQLFTWFLAPWVALNLLLGGVMASVDNLAHIGGLLSGVAIAALLGNRIVAPEDGPSHRSGLAFAAAGLAVMLVSAGFVYGDARVDLPIDQHIKSAAEAQDVDLVVSLWGDLIRRHPNVGLYHTQRADIELVQGDWDSAADDLREAIKLGHSVAQTQNQLAWVLTTRGQVSRQAINEAITLARRSVASSRGPDNLNTLGWALHLRGDHQASRSYLKMGLDLAQERSLWHQATDAAAALLGDGQGEIQAFDLYMLAMVNEALDEHEEATRYLERAEAAGELYEELLLSATDPLDLLKAQEEVVVLHDIATRARRVVSATR